MSLFLSTGNPTYYKFKIKKSPVEAFFCDFF